MYKEIADYIKSANKLVILTGAGISTESGIPDFRSQQGFWSDKRREDVINSDYRDDHPEEFWKYFKDIFQIKLMGNFQPNFGHTFFAELEQEGKDVSVITQNVDGLHREAGNKKVIEVHGNIKRAFCPKHGELVYDLEYINAHDVPRCNQKYSNGDCCNIILKPDVVLFGDPVTKIDDALDEVMEADLFMVLGSSLVVNPIAMLPDYIARKRNIKKVIINGEETAKDGYFDIVIHEKIGDALRKVKEFV